MEFIKKYWKDILLGIFFIVILILIMSTTCTNRKLGVAENNINALQDSLHTYEMKNGALMYEKQGYILKINELEENIGIAKKEAKEIERQLKSALATISKLMVEVRVDTVHTVDSVYVDKDSIYHNYFKYNDQWLSLNGVTTFRTSPFEPSTTINNIFMNVPLKVGTTEDNKGFAISENPYVSFTSVEGANIEKAKPKRFSLAIQLGLGLMGGYGISGAQDGFVRSGWILGGGLYLGIGGSYKLVEF